MGPHKSIPSVHSHSSTVLSAILDSSATPALLHSTSTRPWESMAASANASTSARFDTSVTTPTASCPSARRAAADSSTRLASKSARTTFIPAPTNARAMPSPMPPAAPVMTATLSCGSKPITRF